MKLERLDIATVHKAVSIYLDLAYGGGAGHGKMPDLSRAEGAGPDAVLELFQQEECQAESGVSRVRYSFRLGNRNYPFMKLVLQEHLVGGEYCFGVDTHDEMDIKPDYPDYEAWMAVRRFNQDLKRRIEAQFAEQGLHTSATLRRLAGEQCGEVGAGNEARILVVDDEEDLAHAVRKLLENKGYVVETAMDGAEALRRARSWQPDMMVLDYELPEMDGLEVIAELRENEQTAGIPVLLATAGRISVEDIRRADGFLAKPYPVELLYEMVQRLLGARAERR